jgi:hypothetical protein
MLKRERRKSRLGQKGPAATSGFPADQPPPRDVRTGLPYDPREGSDERKGYPGRGPHDDDATRPVHILDGSARPSPEPPSGDTAMHSGAVPGESGTGEKASEPRR